MGVKYYHEHHPSIAIDDRNSILGSTRLRPSKADGKRVNQIVLVHLDHFNYTGYITRRILHQMEVGREVFLSTRDGIAVLR